MAILAHGKALFQMSDERARRTARQAGECANGGEVEALAMSQVPDYQASALLGSEIGTVMRVHWLG